MDLDGSRSYQFVRSVRNAAHNDGLQIPKRESLQGAEDSDQDGAISADGTEKKNHEWRLKGFVRGKHC